MNVTKNKNIVEQIRIKQIRIKYLVYLLMVLFIIPFAYSVQCTHVGFCQGKYNESCSYVANEICPIDYGDWAGSGCQFNNYGSMCFPCDPDCDDDCGNITVDVDPNLPPSSPALIRVELFTISTTQFPVYFSERVGSGFSPLGTIYCKDLPGPSYYNPNDCTCYPTVSPPNGNICLLNYTAYTPPFGGTSYIYQVQTPLYVSPASDSGTTKPYVDILLPNDNQTYTGPILIEVNASSRFVIRTGLPEEEEDGGGPTGRLISIITGMDTGSPATGFTNITSLNITLYKNTGTSIPQPADPNNNCAVCLTTNCNLLATWSAIPTQTTPGFTRSYDVFSYTWDSSTCGGDYKPFRISAIANDANSNNYDELYNVTLNNPGAPCMDNCPRVSTSILNLVISKIKVWL